MSTTPADIIGLVYTDLAAWTAQNGGTASLTKHPYDLMEQLAHTPSGWRLILHWAGDKPASENVRDCNVVDNTFRVILTGDLGPTVIPSIALIRATAARTPFLAILDAVFQHVMAYRFVGLNPPNNRFWYRGADDNVPLPDGLALAAYNLCFLLRSIKTLPAEGDEIELGNQ